MGRCMLPKCPQPTIINAETLDHIPQIEVNPSLAKLPIEEEILMPLGSSHVAKHLVLILLQQRMAR